MKIDYRSYKDSTSKYVTYNEVSDKVRNYLSTNYAGILAGLVNNDAAEDRVKEIIQKYLKDSGIADAEKLTARLYNDYSKYGFITPYIYDNAIEETDCNSYEDAEIIRAGGAYEKLKGRYKSPQEIQDYAKKIMSIAGITLDASNPLGDGYIDTGVRASAIRAPCVDDNVGAVLSVRRQRTADINEARYIADGSATEEELEFIENLIKYGVSVVFGGPVGSGKTTDMNYFLRRLPDSKRIFVIEDTRELDFVKRDKDGRVLNRVIHTKTRYSDDPKKCITMLDLVRIALRFSSEYIIPSEMRGPEAMAAQEAARTGHTVATSIHTNSAPAAYRRILTMCNMAGTSINDNLLLDMIIEAFPIVVFKRLGPDGIRRIMDIYEATGHENGKIIGHSIFKFTVTDNRYDGKKAVVVGSHARVGGISDGLAARMLDSGAPMDIVKKYERR